MSLIPVLGKVRQEVHHESDGSLDYAVSSKLQGYRVRLCLGEQSKRLER